MATIQGWLARAMVSAIRRGEGHTSVARWSRRSRWSGGISPLDDDLFQGSDDPCPGHWRESPEPWPAGFPDEDSTRRQLGGALGELPPTWRAVARSRDVAGRDAAGVAAELGLTAGQEQRILNRARAALRVALSRRTRQDSE